MRARRARDRARERGPGRRCRRPRERGLRRGTARQPASGAARRDAPPRPDPVRARAGAERAVRRARRGTARARAAEPRNRARAGVALRGGRRLRSRRRSRDLALRHGAAPARAHGALPEELAARQLSGRSSPIEPGELPATATAALYVRALAGAEPLLPPARAADAFALALRSWPDDELVLFAAAGHELGAGDLARRRGALPAPARASTAARGRAQQSRERARRAGLLRAGARRSARRARGRRARATSSTPRSATRSTRSSRAARAATRRSAADAASRRRASRAWRRRRARRCRRPRRGAAAAGGACALPESEQTQPMPWSFATKSRACASQ